MSDFINSLVAEGGPVLAIIAIGFDFGCGLWLWSLVVRFFEWFVNRFDKKNS